MSASKLFGSLIKKTAQPFKAPKKLVNKGLGSRDYDVLNARAKFVGRVQTRIQVGTSSVTCINNENNHSEFEVFQLVQEFLSVAEDSDNLEDIVDVLNFITQREAKDTEKFFILAKELILLYCANRKILTDDNVIISLQRLFVLFLKLAVKSDASKIDELKKLCSKAKLDLNYIAADGRHIWHNIIEFANDSNIEFIEILVKKFSVNPNLGMDEGNCFKNAENNSRHPLLLILSQRGIENNGLTLDQQTQLTLTVDLIRLGSSFTITNEDGIKKSILPDLIDEAYPLDLFGGDLRCELDLALGITTIVHIIRKFQTDLKLYNTEIHDAARAAALRKIMDIRPVDATAAANDDREDAIHKNINDVAVKQLERVYNAIGVQHLWLRGSQLNNEVRQESLDIEEKISQLEEE